ncbi:MAG: class I SAM-dependent methyltransferase [Bacteroidetes bacterium]|nr:MAG: class I SAM-dependent methyltransferase [Bacteroidota bacterium]
MKALKDNFSTQSAVYKKFRPHYPAGLYEEILQQTAERTSCWDCGTGNGQVARVLVQHFRQVYATDISQAQLSQAWQHPRIHYRLQRAGQSGFAANSFDLITVAQAIHWFDIGAFNAEVKRVAKNGGLLAVWGYSLLRITDEMDAIVDAFYREVVGPYWDAERRHIDEQYAGIELVGEAIPAQKEHAIEAEWSLEQLQGYVNSWSSVQHYRKQQAGKNPVEALMQQLRRHWQEGESRKVRFPLFLKMRRIQK